MTKSITNNPKTSFAENDQRFRILAAVKQVTSLLHSLSRALISMNHIDRITKRTIFVVLYTGNILMWLLFATFLPILAIFWIHCFYSHSGVVVVVASKCLVLSASISSADVVHSPNAHHEDALIFTPTEPSPPNPYVFSYTAGRFPGHVDRAHSEVSNGEGVVRGAFSYIDPRQEIRSVEYVADKGIN